MQPSISSTFCFCAIRRESSRQSQARLNSWHANPWAAQRIREVCQVYSSINESQSRCAQQYNSGRWMLEAIAPVGVEISISSREKICWRSSTFDLGGTLRGRRHDSVLSTARQADRQGLGEKEREREKPLEAESKRKDKNLSGSGETRNLLSHRPHLHSGSRLEFCLIHSSRTSAR